MSLVNSHLAAGGGCRGGSLPLPNPLPSPLLLLLERWNPARVPTTAALSSRGNRSTARLGGILGYCGLRDWSKVGIFPRVVEIFLLRAHDGGSGV